MRVNENISFRGVFTVPSTPFDEQLEVDWAKRLASLAANLKAVYIYFNNDAEAFAVRNAITIGDYLQATV